MKSNRLVLMQTRFIRSLLLCFSLLSLSIAMPALGQGVLRGAQTGVIQESRETGVAEIQISGVIYEFDQIETVFTLRGERISSGDLEFGMVVRFTVENGILAEVQILGPNNLIESFNDH